jgi:uncharacterized protein YjdB
MLARGLKAQEKRIAGGENSQAASKVIDEFKTQFPSLVSNPVIKTALPLAPLLFLKPEKKGKGLESLITDPRIWGPALTAAIAIFGQTGTQEPYEVIIKPGTFTLPTPTSGTVGKKVTLKATVYDRNRRLLSTQPKISWESNDPNIAKVDEEKGEVTAVAAGTVLITATVTGTSVLDSATVTVQ